MINEILAYTPDTKKSMRLVSRYTPFAPIGASGPLSQCLVNRMTTLKHISVTDGHNIRVLPRNITSVVYDGCPDGITVIEHIVDVKGRYCQPRYVSGIDHGRGEEDICCFTIGTVVLLIFIYVAMFAIAYYSIIFEQQHKILPGTTELITMGIICSVTFNLMIFFTVVMLCVMPTRDSRIDDHKRMR